MHYLQNLKVVFVPVLQVLLVLVLSLVIGLWRRLLALATCGESAGYGARARTSASPGGALAFRAYRRALLAAYAGTSTYIPVLYDQGKGVPDEHTAYGNVPVLHLVQIVPIHKSRVLGLSDVKAPRRRATRKTATCCECEAKTDHKER